MNSLTAAIKSKGWRMKDVAERWNITPRQMSNIAKTPKQIHWDAVAGLPKREDGE
jgi:hypothetical protein